MFFVANLRMNTDREAILSRVRDSLAPLHDRAPLPDWDTELAIMRRLVPQHDPWTVFCERLQAVNGLALDSPAVLAAWLREQKHLHGYCDPALWPQLAPHFGNGFMVETDYDRTRVDDYAFGITAGSRDGTFLVELSRHDIPLGVYTQKGLQLQ